MDESTKITKRCTGFFLFSKSFCVRLIHLFTNGEKLDTFIYKFLYHEMERLVLE